MKEIDKYLIHKDTIIKDAMKALDKSGKKNLFVVDKEGKLFGALTDGDIRRWILKSGSFDEKVESVCNKNPIFVHKDLNIEESKKILLKKSIEAVPVLDSNDNINNIIFWEEIFQEDCKREYSKINLPVVIMAGGKGTRLDPFTRILPKPLIPIGEKTMIEVIMDEYAKFGMKRFYISINHKGKMIRAYFEDHQSDYTFYYINEDKPLGTAGALRYLRHKMESPFFVSNCDIIIKDNYAKIYNFHKKGNYTLTIVASMQHYTIPYGICEIENGGMLTNIKEKPEYDFLVNTGMYLLNPEVLEYIPKNQFYHITHLINKLQKEGFSIGVYPVSEKSWVDVGKWEEYNKSLNLLINKA